MAGNNTHTNVWFVITCNKKGYCHEVTIRNDRSWFVGHDRFGMRGGRAVGADRPARRSGARPAGDPGAGRRRAARTPDAANSSCPDGAICLYQNANYNGARTGCKVVIRPPDRNLDLASETCGNGNFNNQMTSWKNRSGTRYCWWVDVGERGNQHLMNPHTWQPQVSSQANDRASAIGPC
jgi:hypothetical protein